MHSAHFIITGAGGKPQHHVPYPYHNSLQTPFLFWSTTNLASNISTPRDDPHTNKHTSWPPVQDKRHLQGLEESQGKY